MARMKKEVAEKVAIIKQHISDQVSIMWNEVHLLNHIGQTKRAESLQKIIRKLEAWQGR